MPKPRTLNTTQTWKKIYSFPRLMQRLRSHTAQMLEHLRKLQEKQRCSLADCFFLAFRPRWMFSVCSDEDGWCLMARPQCFKMKCYPQLHPFNKRPDTSGLIAYGNHSSCFTWPVFSEPSRQRRTKISRPKSVFPEVEHIYCSVCSLPLIFVCLFSALGMCSG